MDTVFDFHRWLLWIALVLLLNQCKAVSGFSQVCPQGELMHPPDPHSHFAYPTCCYPTRCGVGQEVKACSVNGTQDKCEQCNPHYNQSRRTSSYTMERCTYWPVDHECKNVNTRERDISDWRTKRCMCNIELGLKYDPPEAMYPGAPADAYCQRMLKPCMPGHEPTEDGRCKPCDDNYFKDSESFKLCEPKTNCSMLRLEYIFQPDSATADNNCSKPEPVTTPRPVVTEKPSLGEVSQKPSHEDRIESTTTLGTTHRGDTARSGSSTKGDDAQNSDSPHPAVIGGVVAFLVIVVVVITVIMLYRKRKGKPICVCGTTRNCTDPEKPTPCSVPMNGDQANKHQMGNGSINPHHLTGGDKVTNNNSNGGLHYNVTLSPQNGHSNVGVSQHYTTPGNNSDFENQAYYPNQNEVSPVTAASPTFRPGILRNGQNRRPGHAHAVSAQSRGHVPDWSIDSIGQEKLQVGGLEASQETEENDPLLVTGAAAAQDVLFQRSTSSPSGSPPLMQAGVNPIYFPTPAYVKGGPSSPLMQPQGAVPQVTFTPATGTATFTRSTSVIASPEGEVDEDEIEARVPRFSQLLPDGEESAGSNPNPRMAQKRDSDPFRYDSPGRETTQQLRSPADRLGKSPLFGPSNGNMLQQRQQGHPAPQQQVRMGQPPALVGPVPHRGPQESQPDHCIMNLKEQQLAESLHSSSNNSSTNTPLKNTPDVSETDLLKTVVPSSDEAQQTELKTRLSPIIDSDFPDCGASINAKTVKEESDPQATEPKQMNTGGYNMSERRRQTSGGSSGQNTTERKRLQGRGITQNDTDRKRQSSGGSNSSGQNTLERRYAPSGDQQRSCMKSSSSDENEDSTRKHRYNRTVSFEEDESPQTVNRQRSHTTEPWQLARSENATEKAHTDSRYRGPMRSVSDPEQKTSRQNTSDDDETERKCASLEYNAGNSSSKSSVSSDLSVPDSNHSSPSKASVYRRSQSEMASNSSESPHKASRSMSAEDKPQKPDHRPIAKVKPMPASDNAVNQLPVEVSDDTNVTAPVAASNAGVNIHDLSSEESDEELNTERAQLETSGARDEEGRRQSEQESEESGGE